MKRGTHNLGRNAHGKLALVRVNDDGLLIQVEGFSVVLSQDQAQLLKDVLA